MSFILDALRKSETERQEQAGGEFSSVPSSSGESQSPKWLWMLALLLLVNVVCVIVSAKIVFLAKGVQPRTWYERARARQSVVLHGAIWGLLLLLLLLIVFARHRVFV